MRLCPVCRVNTYEGDAPACPTCMARGAARTPSLPPQTPPGNWAQPYPPPPGYAPAYAPGLAAASSGPPAPAHGAARPDEEGTLVSARLNIPPAQQNPRVAQTGAPPAALGISHGGAIPPPVSDAPTITPAPVAGGTPGVDPLIGRTPLGQYLIEKKLGEGGFGAVYLARQLGVDRKAVIKVLHKNLGSTEAFVSRFHREAKAVGLLSDPHIVSVYNFGAMEDGTLFVAMEYGGDHTVADALEKTTAMELARALDLAAQIGQALREAHSHGIIHRDLKPSNIMLQRRMTGEEWAKVVDFGIAKIMQGSGETGESAASLTQTGQVIGTPAYFSPEQARGMKVDARSDLYSLGVVLYQMITGRLPIKALTPIDYIRAHAIEPPTPPSEHGVTVPGRVEKLLMKSLEKDPRLRFASAKEMLDEIEACRRLVADMQTRAALKRFPWKWVGAAAAGVLAVGTAALILLRGEPAPPPLEPEPARPNLVEKLPAPVAPPVAVTAAPAEQAAATPVPPTVAPASPPLGTSTEPAPPPRRERPVSPPVKGAAADRRRAAAVDRAFVVKSVDGKLRVSGPDRFHQTGAEVRIPVAGAGTWNVHQASDAWVVTLDVRPDGPNLDITVTSNPVALMSVGDKRGPRELAFTLRDEPVEIKFTSPANNQKWSLLIER